MHGKKRVAYDMFRTHILLTAAALTPKTRLMTNGITMISRPLHPTRIEMVAVLRIVKPISVGSIATQDGDDLKMEDRFLSMDLINSSFTTTI